MINTDTYSFLALSGLTCHLADTGIGVSGCSVPPDSKENELGSSSQEVSPSAGKNTVVVLVLCCTWKCVPTAILGGVDVSKVLGCFCRFLYVFDWLFFYSVYYFFSCIDHHLHLYAMLLRLHISRNHLQ